MLKPFQFLAATAALIGLLFSQAQAQDESELAKQTQNPVADLISVPLQNNFNFGAGSKDKMIYILNVQPVIPIKIAEDWNLITRVIMPIISQPSLFPGVDSAAGLGRHQPDILFLTVEAEQFDLGFWADVYFADGERSSAWQRQVEHGTGGRSTDNARAVGVWRADE